MTTRTATVTKEYGEIGFGSSKREGYAWEVEFLIDGRVIDRQTIKLEAEYRAFAMAALFQTDSYSYGEYGQVVFDEAQLASLVEILTPKLEVIER